MVRPGAPPTLLSYWRQPLPGFYQLPLGSSCPSLCGQSVTPPEQNAPKVCMSPVDAGHSRPLGLLTGLETSSRSSISEPALPPQLVFSLRATNESSSFSNHSSAFTLINETGLQQNTWQAHSTRFQSFARASFFEFTPAAAEDPLPRLQPKHAAVRLLAATFLSTGNHPPVHPKKPWSPYPIEETATVPPAQVHPNSR